MKCEICGERPAKVHYTEMKDDEVRQLRLCERCAEEKGLTKLDGKYSFSLPDLLGGLADDDLPGEKPQGPSIGCPCCGLTYSQFKATGRLGCSECYDVFHAPLGPLLKRVHGADTHTGKTPPGRSRPRSEEAELRTLKLQLEEAIRHEDFESAATIRDRIRALES